MIGQFRYHQTPTNDCVQVKMLWDGGQRAGRLSLPEHLLEQIELDELPSSAETFTIASAMAYALVLSMKAGLPLMLSGDMSVWRSEWGAMIQVH